MPRQSKPYFRQQTKSWYCSIGGKQIPLGKNKTEAHEKFYELMGPFTMIRREAGDARNQQSEPPKENLWP